VSKEEVEALKGLLERVEKEVYLSCLSYLSRTLRSL
jgi:hypothetical protein